MRTFINIFLFYFLLISFSVQAFPIPKNNKITYEIIRKNKVIGLHEIFFNEENGNLNIETKIKEAFRKILPKPIIITNHRKTQ